MKIRLFMYVSGELGERRGIFITGSSLLGGAIRVPRITSKNLIRYD